MAQTESLFDVPVPRRHRRVRDTSVASYAVGREKFTGRQADVLRWLAAYWNLHQESPTSAELDDAMYQRAFDPGCRDEWLRSVSADYRLLWVRRGLSDLQTHGLVETVEKRKCAVTDRLCRTWRVRQR